MIANESKSAHVHRVFSHIAKRYDLMNSVLSFYQHKLWRRFAMRHVPLDIGGSALDVACGTGDWTIALARRTGSAGRVVGIDFVKEMLEVAEQKVKRQDLLNHPIELIEGNAMSLPFADSSFDVATIGFALRNVPDVLTVLQEMRRVVKPGGTVVSLELSKPEFPPFRALYYLYFNHLLPVIGKLAVKKAEPYAWLPESLKGFPNRLGLEELFRQAGLKQVKSFPLTGGIAALHVGTKLEDSSK